MRITAEQKQRTRERILETALKLFRTQGYDGTTTRDIAQAADIATGTLFNYFTTKEAIVTALVEEALEKGIVAADVEPRSGPVEEALFALTAAELRQLKPLRKLLRPVLETTLSPLAGAGSGESIRLRHLETVAGIVRRHGLPEPSGVTLQLYWTLYTGVLAFWAGDSSPRQEDTLALLDDSMSMFAHWLTKQP